MIMDLLVAVLYIALGFFFLMKGADFFVDSASGIAAKLGVSSLIIGLTIVAFGTSLPELAVSVTAALDGSNEIAVGNVVGSNIFNVSCCCRYERLYLSFGCKQNHYEA